MQMQIKTQQMPFPAPGLKSSAVDPSWQRLKNPALNAYDEDVNHWEFSVPGLCTGKTKWNSQETGTCENLLALKCHCLWYSLEKVRWGDPWRTLHGKAAVTGKNRKEPKCPWPWEWIWTMMYVQADDFTGMESNNLPLHASTLADRRH